MTIPLSPEPADAVPPPGGQPARTRLLLAALKLFSEQGYAKTSIRAIAALAHANVAAVSYYFGDKAALYRAVFTEPMGGGMHALIPSFTQPGMTLQQSLQAYFHGALAALNHGDIARQCLRLHIREMLDPTSQWEQELEKDVRAPHRALVGLLCRHFGQAQEEAGDDLHRLALTIAGLAFQLWSYQEVVAAVRPSLLATPEAVDTWAARFADYAMAMVAAEHDKRREP